MLFKCTFVYTAPPVHPVHFITLYKLKKSIFDYVKKYLKQLFRYAIALYKEDSILVR